MGENPESHTPHISVIVPARNMVATVGDCVGALRRQTLHPAAYEIIVVDDGSSDGTAQAAERAGAHRVLRKPPGGYAAAARNLGIEAARGEIACFTDADCCPAPDWLAQITAPLADPEIAGVKGVYTTTQRSLVARFVQLEYEEKYEHLRRQPRISFIDFYAAAFRRQVLVSNGGFDETFPNSEDRELSFRLATRGYQMVFQPHAVVHHLHAATLGDYFFKKIRNGYWTAQVVRRFPSHSVDDSYTPQSMKVQILLAGLAYFFLALMVLNPFSGLLTAGALLAFLLTALPLWRSAWRKDRPLALVLPLLLVARATALGVGYGWGLLRPVPLQRQPATISGLNYVAKRAVDIAAGLLGTLLTLLILPFVALRSRNGRPLWHQERQVGQHGRPLTLRTFNHTQTPSRWHKLPYFWHVLKGEMSLVGPRPESEEALAVYADWHRQRLAVRPGILPVDGAAGDCPDERIHRELDYIANYSLWRDLQLIGRAMGRKAK